MRFLEKVILNLKKEVKDLSNSNNNKNNNGNNTLVKEAKSAMDNMKYEIAKDLGIDLKEGYNGDLTSKEAGYVGGEMVRRMIMEYQKKNS